jgi:hypothetical protein
MILKADRTTTHPPRINEISAAAIHTRRSRWTRIAPRPPQRSRRALLTHLSPIRIRSHRDDHLFGALRRLLGGWWKSSRLCLLAKDIKFLSDRFAVQPNASLLNPLIPQLKFDAQPSFKSTGFWQFSRVVQDIFLMIALFQPWTHPTILPIFALSISQIMREFEITNLVKFQSAPAAMSGRLVGRFHGSNRMPTKLNCKDVAATQKLTRNLRWQPI